MLQFIAILIAIVGIYISVAHVQGYPPFEEPSDVLRGVIPGVKHRDTPDKPDIFTIPKEPVREMR